MGVTIKKLKSGTVFLAQKRVAGVRESKTFTERLDADKWMEEKTAENILALTQPEVYDAPLKMLKAVVREWKVFEEKVDHLEIFRICPDSMKDEDFMIIFNAVPDYERTPAMLKRYKRLLAVKRKGIKD
jgi:hypothetical protein